jgi:hypothetical protein
LERHKNIVQHHLVFKWTSLAPGEKFSPAVGASNLSELQPSLIRNSIHSVILACHNAGLGVCNVTGDGAGENVKVFVEMSKADCLQHIDPATMLKFPDVDFEAEKLLAMEHPVTREPAFVLEDMPHVVKRLGNVSQSTIEAETQMVRQPAQSLDDPELLGSNGWQKSPNARHQVDDASFCQGCIQSNEGASSHTSVVGQRGADDQMSRGRRRGGLSLRRLAAHKDH